MHMDENISIISLNFSNKLHEVERLQKEIWSFSNNQIVHSRLLADMQRVGGLLLGAIDKKNKSLVGFLFGFVGFKNSEIKHCSYMLGVLPEFRSKGIGYLLKLEQRNYVMKQGINLITWTFDPLESINGNLNFRKLAGIAKEYKCDQFGFELGNHNDGLPSDRLVVDWRITDQSVHQRLYPKKTPKRGKPFRCQDQDVGTINKTYITKDVLVMKDYNLKLNNSIILLEIPSNFQIIKQNDMKLALEWRLSTREIFKNYLSQNYIIKEFLTDIDPETGNRKNYYVLAKQANF